MKTVFISYSTDASKKAKSVSNRLSTLGVNSFIFEKNIKRETSTAYSDGLFRHP
ncbi:MAG: hypothetical protein QM500_15730 [Methylococcales bacterium]